jgi:hypothetical protein
MDPTPPDHAADNHKCVSLCIIFPSYLLRHPYYAHAMSCWCRVMVLWRANPIAVAPQPAPIAQAPALPPPPPAHIEANQLSIERMLAGVKRPADTPGVASVDKKHKPDLSSVVAHVKAALAAVQSFTALSLDDQYAVLSQISREGQVDAAISRNIRATIIELKQDRKEDDRRFRLAIACAALNSQAAPVDYKYCRGAHCARTASWSAPRDHLQGR